MSKAASDRNSEGLLVLFFKSIESNFRASKSFSTSSFFALKNLSADLLNLSHNLLSFFLPAEPANFHCCFKSLNFFIQASLSSSLIRSTFAINDSFAFITIFSCRSISLEIGFLAS